MPNSQARSVERPDETVAGLDCGQKRFLNQVLSYGAVSHARQSKSEQYISMFFNPAFRVQPGRQAGAQALGLRFHRAVVL